MSGGSAQAPGGSSSNDMDAIQGQGNTVECQIRPAPTAAHLQESANAGTFAAAGLAEDTPMQGTQAYEMLAPVAGENDEDEVMSSANESRDWEYSDNELGGGDPYLSTDEEELEARKHPIRRPEDIGRLINEAFPVDPGLEIGDDEDQDIFDDGLDGDDSDSGSDVSTVYEELTEPTVFVQVLEVPASPSKQEPATDEDVLGSDDSEFIYEDSEEVQTDEGMDTPDGSEETQPHASNTQHEVLALTDAATIQKKSFSELQQEQYKLLYKTSEYTWSTKLVGSFEREFRPQITREQECDAIRWRLLELEEAKKAIEEQMLLAERQLEEEESAKDQAVEKLAFALEFSGISEVLWEAYNAFCSSLDPEFGQRGGFSITCDADHEGCYTSYDPQFQIFKESVEGAYSNCNFRCESFSEPARAPGMGYWDRSGTAYIVEFWPLKCPDPLTGTESTWGEQYPELYSLATAAVREGSEAAMDMLVCLPDMNSTFNSGWLFDYVFEPTLKDSPIVGKRWRFRSAHKIDQPCTVEEKRQRLELALRPENVR